MDLKTIFYTWKLLIDLTSLYIGDQTSPRFPKWSKNNWLLGYNCIISIHDSKMTSFSAFFAENISFLMINLVILSHFTLTTQSGIVNKISSCEAIGYAFESSVLRSFIFSPKNFYALIQISLSLDRFLLLIRLISRDFCRIWRKNCNKTITSGGTFFPHDKLIKKFIAYRLNALGQFDIPKLALILWLINSQ